MNESAYRAGTRVRIHRKLAENVASRCVDDAAPDKVFFAGTPMTDALKATTGTAVEEEQSLRIEDHFSDREQYLINLWIDQTVALLKTEPAYFAAALRQENLAAVGAALRALKIPKASKKAARAKPRKKSAETP